MDGIARELQSFEGRWRKRFWRCNLWAETRRIRKVFHYLLLSTAPTLMTSKLPTATLDGIIIDRPCVEDSKKQHLCLDASYACEQVNQYVLARNYIPHILASRRRD